MTLLVLCEVRLPDFRMVLWLKRIQILGTIIDGDLHAGFIPTEERIIVDLA